jgi:hypothetical protein
MGRSLSEIRSRSGKQVKKMVSVSLGNAGQLYPQALFRH